MQHQRFTVTTAAIAAVFLLLTLLSLCCLPLTRVEHSLADALPASHPAALAQQTLEDHFSDAPSAALQQNSSVQAILWANAGIQAQEESADDENGSAIPLIVISFVAAALLILSLLFTAPSWQEGLLLSVCLAVSVLIQTGSHAFFNHISRLSYTLSIPLQVSMTLAMSLPSMHGRSFHRGGWILLLFVLCPALCLLRLSIGVEWAVVLLKGCVISLLTACILLPALVKLFQPLEKPERRRRSPALHTALPLLLCAVLGVLCSCVSLSDAFSAPSDSDAQLLIPRDSIAQEAALTESLQALPQVASVSSWAADVGADVPEVFAGSSLVSLYRSGDYSRLIISPTPGLSNQAADELISRIQSTAEEHLTSQWLLTGDNLLLQAAQDEALVSLQLALLSLLIPVLAFGVQRFLSCRTHPKKEVRHDA